MKEIELGSEKIKDEVVLGKGYFVKRGPQGSSFYDDGSKGKGKEKGKSGGSSDNSWVTKEMMEARALKHEQRTPEQKKMLPCTAETYGNGKCSYGDRCHYNHAETLEKQRQALGLDPKTGKPKKGAKVSGSAGLVAGAVAADSVTKGKGTPVTEPAPGAAAAAAPPR